MMVLYPGSFDPVTFGHLNLIERGIRQFGKLHVAVAKNIRKQALFDVEERVALLQTAVRHLPHVSIGHFEGLLVHYAKQIGATTILRGLRAISDFEFEFQMAHVNRRLHTELETIFMMTGEEHFYVSSQVVREIASFGGAIDKFVPAHVAQRLQEKIDGAR